MARTLEVKPTTPGPYKLDPGAGRPRLSITMRNDIMAILVRVQRLEDNHRGEMIEEFILEGARRYAESPDAWRASLRASRMAATDPGLIIHSQLPENVTPRNGKRRRKASRADTSPRSAS